MQAGHETHTRADGITQSHWAAGGWDAQSFGREEENWCQVNLCDWQKFQTLKKNQKEMCLSDLEDAHGECQQDLSTVEPSYLQ